MRPAQEYFSAPVRLHIVPTGENENGQLAGREPVASVRTEDHAPQLGTRQRNHTCFFGPGLVSLRQRLLFSFV